MRIEYPEYYEKFHCLAEACPDTCCKDWEVDVDEDTFYYYRVQEGTLGEKLNRLLKEEGEAKYIPLREDGRCPFLREDGLCEICAALGEEGLSQTCQEYPRYYMGIGDYEQIDLSLSCMEVGRLLFTGKGPVHYVKDTDEEEPWETLEEGEQERLVNVLKLRDEILQSLAGYEAGTENAEEVLPEVLPDESADEELLELIPELEILDTEGAGLIAAIQQDYTEIRDCEAAFRERYEELLRRLFTRFAAYLVYRYTIDSYYEDMENVRRLWRRSLRLVLLMCINCDRQSGSFGIGSMIRLTHSFSRQIEHSDENLELWKTRRTAP